VESVPLLRVFGCTVERERRFRTAVEMLRFRSFEAGFATLPMSILVLLFIEIGFTAMIIAGTALALFSTIVGPAFFVALIVGIRFFQSLADAADGYLRLRDAAPNISRVAELLDLPEAGGGEIAQARGGHALELDDVCFSFDRGPVLRNISCVFPERGLTAVVGRSGAGKTALAGVIAGLWDAESGTVSVGGADLWKMSPAERARLVSYVFQETYLFEDTVINNIRAGRAGVSDLEVRRAAKAANCDAIIERLPQGYETVLRAGGANLSLGERQRIAIARAFLSEAPILIFDESTASLDAVSEHAVHRAIETLAQEKTIVLITHRLGTVRNAKQILVLSRGELVESGSHERLLACKGEYAALWRAHERARLWRAAG
jgi:ATP-binding cassette subfamily B protein IrtB